MVPAAGSADLHHIYAELAVLRRHLHKVGLRAQPPGIRAQLIAVGVVERREVVLGFAPGAGLTGRNPMIAGRAQQVRMRIQVVTCASCDEHETAERCAALQCVVNGSARSMRINDVLRLREFGACLRGF